MELVKCNASDSGRIIDFYKYLSENTPNMETYGRWIYGQHPTDEMIEGYIEGGYMYYAKVGDGDIIAAVALTPFQGEDYHPVNWAEDLNDDEVMVVHILCVDPKLQGTGTAAKVMEAAIKLAESQGLKAVRLDALSCNLPAHRLYERLGFQQKGIQNWYAENTGWIDFYLYELNI